MQKILTFGILSVLFVFPFLTSAASVTIDTIPTVCSSAVFRGSASYVVPNETLNIKLNGASIASFTTGDSMWQVTYRGNFISDNSLTAEISSSTAGVLASATQSFGASCGNSDPNAVTQIWGMDGYHTPKARLGQLLTDEFGLTEMCTYFGGCLDIRNTNYYRLPILKFFKTR